MTKGIKRILVLFLLLAVFVGVVSAIQPVLSDWYRQIVIPLKYETVVDSYCEEYKVPCSVVYAIIKCESGFDPRAVSHAGAKGLMQLMPDTFEWAVKKVGGEYCAEQIFEPEANIHIGVYYLSWLYERFGSWELVYASYNAGHNRVSDWLKNGKLYASDGTLTIPIEETARYVEKVSRYRAKYLDHYTQLKEKENSYE